MIYTREPLSVILFFLISSAAFAISVYLGRQTDSEKGFFISVKSRFKAVNGIALAGDYLSAAGFLGICGLIAALGFRGFLYSIGLMAGWMVALFIMAEPIKKLGRYTFADVLDARYKSKGVQFMAGMGTLVVSVFFLIPQMVGVGAIVTPILGIPHWAGVVIAGLLITLIATAVGMKSIASVQFLKGSFLLIFSVVLTFMLLNGNHQTVSKNESYRVPKILPVVMEGESITGTSEGYSVAGNVKSQGYILVALEKSGVRTWWSLDTNGARPQLREALSKTRKMNGDILYNGAPKDDGQFYSAGTINRRTKRLNLISYLGSVQDSEVVRYVKQPIRFNGDRVTVWIQKPTEGTRFLSPRLTHNLTKNTDEFSKLDFISLMLALFLGASSLPHIFARYYILPSSQDTRKITLIAVCAMGFFFLLTFYIGLGAAVNGIQNVAYSNLSVLLLSQKISPLFFSILSAILLASILGTACRLTVVSSGAVAHGLMDCFGRAKFSLLGKITAGNMTIILLGILSIIFGIIFQRMNIAFLFGWAFAIAASTNLPSIVMMLFWKNTTAKGITASILVGLVSSISLILLSPRMFELYGLSTSQALVPLDNPGIISIPLSFLTLIFISLITKKTNQRFR